MIHFDCDYLHGAHPKIMDRLAQATLEPHSGYGFDPYCEEAAALIRDAVDSPYGSGQEVLQYFGSGGVPQLAQGLGLDLADPLPGDVELLAHLL